MTQIVDMRGYDPLKHNLFGLDYLHQNKEWIDRSGKRWKLEDMESSHRSNLLAFLRQRALSLAFKDTMLEEISPLAPGGDMALDAMYEAQDWRLQNPKEWLEQTPLVKRLVELVAEDDTYDPF